MKNNSSSTGSVPVTIQLPAEIAARIQQRNYNFGPLLELLDGESFSPSDAAEALLSIYFAFTQAMILYPDATDVNKWDTNVHLGTLEKLYRAFKCMEKTVATSSEPAMESGE